jgi:ribosomal-protein-alanine N-acetyltransferase
MNDFPKLETERLILREWDITDAPDLFAFYSKEDVLRYTPVKPHVTLEDSEASIERFRKRFREANTGVIWAIELKENGRVIGECAVNHWIPKYFRADLGYSFNPDYSGKGYAREAVGRIVNYLFTEFDQFKLNRLEAITDPRNTASIKLLEKLGFIQEGILRDYEYEKGEFVDSVMYAMLRRDRK